MKKHLNKVLWAVVMLVVLTAALTITTGIINPASQEKAQVEATETIKAEVPKASRTAVKYIYYYREYNGWIQKRLWNRTAGKWADPYWHNVQKVNR